MSAQESIDRRNARQQKTLRLMAEWPPDVISEEEREAVTAGAEALNEVLQLRFAVRAAYTELERVTGRRYLAPTAERGSI